MYSTQPKLRLVTVCQWQIDCYLNPCKCVTYPLGVTVLINSNTIKSTFLKRMHHSKHTIGRFAPSDVFRVPNKLITSLFVSKPFRTHHSKRQTTEVLPRFWKLRIFGLLVVSLQRYFMRDKCRTVHTFYG